MTNLRIFHHVITAIFNQPMRDSRAVTWRKQTNVKPSLLCKFVSLLLGAAAICQISTLIPPTTAHTVLRAEIILIKYLAIATKSLQSACHVSERPLHSYHVTRYWPMSGGACNWIELNKSEVLSTQGGSESLWQAREGGSFSLRSDKSKQVIILLYPVTWGVTSF